MILDAHLKLSDSQIVTVTAPSANIIDQGSKADALGSELWLITQVREAALAAGAATVNFQIQSADDSGFGTNLTTHFDSGAIGKAALTLNSEPVKVRLPIGLRKFVRVNYVIGTGPLTAGKFDAFITPDVNVG